jgi:hypothetical protein
MTAPIRFRALFLLLALVAGGFGLPLADALCFHGTPGAASPAERILSSDTPTATHVQVCHLGHATPPERSLGSTSGLPNLHPIPGLQVSSVLDPRFVASSELTLPPSRGPPAA